MLEQEPGYQRAVAIGKREERIGIMLLLGEKLRSARRASSRVGPGGERRRRVSTAGRCLEPEYQEADESEAGPRNRSSGVEHHAALFHFHGILDRRPLAGVAECDHRTSRLDGLKPETLRRPGRHRLQQRHLKEAYGR